MLEGKNLIGKFSIEIFFSIYVQFLPSSPVSVLRLIPPPKRDDMISDCSLKKIIKK